MFVDRRQSGKETVCGWPLQSVVTTETRKRRRNHMILNSIMKFIDAEIAAVDN